MDRSTILGVLVGTVIGGAILTGLILTENKKLEQEINLHDDVENCGYVEGKFNYSKNYCELNWEVK